MKVLITGATGAVGRRLALQVVLRGHELVVLSRNAQRAKQSLGLPGQYYAWDARGPLPSGVFDGVEAVVHLAGESVAGGRWTATRKRAILESRTLSTTALVRDIALHAPQLRVLCCASAIGFYGDRGDSLLHEEDASGQAFLSEVCRAWEDASLRGGALAPTIRRVALRTGVVLDPTGGALQVLVPTARAHLAGRSGSGRQWVSWIHVEDLVELYLRVIADDSAAFTGALNAVAPGAVRNKEWMDAIGRTVGSRVQLPAPAWSLKLALGEMSWMILASQRVSSERVMERGFCFKYPYLADAMRSFGGDLIDQSFASAQFVRRPLEDVFPFFAEARNLEAITPSWLNFRITSQSTPDVRAGTLIRYRLKVHGIPASWLTLIERWDPPHAFADRQLRGPYSKWFHTHEFHSLRGGTLLLDRVQYRPPLGLLGLLVAGRWVSAQVREIFGYRYQAIEARFP